MVVVRAINQIGLIVLSLSWLAVSYQHRGNTAECAASLCVAISAQVLAILLRLGKR